MLSRFCNRIPIDSSSHLLLLLVLASGCGYHIAGVPGQGPLSPSDSVAIPFFVNATDEPLIEEEITPRVRQEFVRDGRLHLMDGPGARWVMLGRIVSFTETPLAFDVAQNVQEYRVAVTVHVELNRQSNGEKAWSQDLMATAEYRVTHDIVAVRIAKRQAIAEAARNLSEDLVDHLIEGYR